MQTTTTPEAVEPEQLSDPGPWDLIARRPDLRDLRGAAYAAALDGAVSS